jgi:UDP-glucose 4-epimerase
VHVLVTGGAGYIGSITAQVLIDAGHRVSVVDDLSRGHREMVPPACDLHAFDVGDAEAIGAVVAGVDACIHFAGFIDVAESVEHPDLYMTTNEGKTAVLLDALIAAGVERLVFSSSAAVYGTPDRVPIPVDHPRRPESPYGASKAAAEDAIVARADRLRYASLRYFNPAGAAGGRGEDHPNETHLIPRVLDVAVGRRDAIGVNGSDYPTRDGTCVRDFLHVADLAEAHVRALDALESRPATVCNVGTGTGSTVLEVIEACREVTGHPIPVAMGPRRPGDPAALVADTSETARLLDWEPRVRDLGEIVRSAWDWHRARAATP